MKENLIHYRLRLPVSFSDDEDQEKNFKLIFKDRIYNYSPNLNTDDLTFAHIIQSFMSLPFFEAQKGSPLLSKLTIAEIKSIFIHNLYNLEKEAYKIEKLPISRPFTIEEDVWLYIYSKMNPGEKFEKTKANYASKILPIRAKSDVSARYSTINGLADVEIEKLLDSLSEELLLESLIAESIETIPKNVYTWIAHDKCRNYLSEQFSDTTYINSEIDDLFSMFPEASDSIFNDFDLAVLRTDSYMFRMTHSRVLVGFSHTHNFADIDLHLISPQECNHISEHQAIISFLPNFFFYIENVGKSLFRVNGIIIRPGQACKIPPLSIIDFCDILFMFIPNESLIKKIAKEAGKPYNKTKW